MCRVIFLLLACGHLLGAELLYTASFEDYSVGEAVGVKGTHGGNWQVGGNGTATNVAAVGRQAMDVTGKLVFESTQTATNDVELIDVPLLVGPLSLTGIHPPGGAGGIMPVLVAENTPGYLVWGSGAWQRTTAEGAPPVEGTWVEIRMVFKVVEGHRLVRYLVKNPQGDYVPCQTKEGRIWFLAGERTGARKVEFIGKGTFSDFAGRQEAGTTERCFHWTGGASGDWNEAANWAEGRVPDDGSFAFVTNTVTLTRNGEQAEVKSLVVADGDRFVGGRLKTAIELKTNRPRVGKELEPTVGAFFGIVPDYTFTWRRANWAKTWETGAIGRNRAYTPTERDYGKWLRLTVSNATEAVFSKDLFFSSLPVCYLTTDNGRAPSASKEVHTGSLFVQGNDAFKHQYDGRLEFHVRGDSSVSHPKKSYKLKLDEKTKMFDLGDKKNRHWVLTSNYHDVSCLRNKLAADFANEIGSLGMRSTWTDCVLNGEYIGTYVFMEAIRIATGRVDIFDWEEAVAPDGELAGLGASETNFAPIDAALAANPGAVDISGGYLFEYTVNNQGVISKFTAGAGNLSIPVVLKKPEYLKTSSRMMDWCRRYLQNYFDACTSLTHLSAEGRHWSEYADVDSMVNYWLVVELHGNLDAYQKSRYAYIDRGGKLMWGPVWDFDYASASQTIPTAQAADTWMCTNKDWDNSVNTWNSSSWLNFTSSSIYKEWASDPYFCLKAWERYWEIRPKFCELFRDGGTIDQAAAQLSQALTVNDARWPRTRAHADDTNIYKNYLRERLVWLDRQFESVESLMASLKSSRQTVPYVRNEVAIRPAVDETRLEVAATLVGATAVEVFLNGVRLGKSPLVSGRLDALELPKDRLSRGERKLNCVSFISYDAANAVIGCNYILFPTPASNATRIFFR